MKESFTVSGIAKRTGLDRRTLDRALLGLSPVAVTTIAGRQSPRYDRDEVTQLLAAAGVPREKVALLMPFAGSPSRLVAWNVLTVYAEMFQQVLAGERADWAAHAAVLALQTADVLLAEFADRCPETVELDAVVGGTMAPGRDANPGQFLAAMNEPASEEVRAMFVASLEALRR